MKIKKSEKKYKDWIIVIVLFILSTFIRYIIADFPKRILVYPDELRYYSIANDLYHNIKITIHNLPSNFQKILYSIFLMPAFFFDDVTIRIKAISFINSFIMCSGIFPIFLLGINICKNKANIYYSIILYVLMSEMSYTMTFMSEVAYYPIAIWTIYLFYKLLTIDKKDKKKISISIILGVLIYILYLNKEIALSFLVTYGCYIIGLAIYDHKTIKYNYKNFLLMLVSFSVMFIFGKLTIFKGMGNSYNQMGIEAILSAYNIFYMLYSYFFSLIIVIISFGYFPITYPIIYFNKLEKKHKEFFIFIIGLILVSAGVMAYTISVREDLGRIGPRQHLRYIGFIFPVIWLVFLEILDNVETNLLLIKKMITVTIIYLITFIFIYNGFTHAIVDHTSLKYLKIFDHLTLTGGVNEISFNVGRLVLKIFLSCILLGEILILIKNKKLFRNTILIIILSLCFINNSLSIKENKQNYSITKEQSVQLQTLNTEISGFTGNILFIMETGLFEETDGLIDTYISSPNLFITCREDMIEIMKNTTSYKISEMEIHSKFPFDVYENLDTINYVILPTTYLMPMPEEYFENIKVEGITDYKIFRNKNPEYLLINSMSKGQSIEYKLDQNNYYSEYKIENGEFISDDEDGFLIYGPYIDLEKGLYKVEFYYEYLGSSNEDIGYVDFSVNGQPLYQKTINAQDIYATIDDIKIEENISGVETRFYTTEPGIKVKKIVITKR